MKKRKSDRKLIRAGGRTPVYKSLILTPNQVIFGKVYSSRNGLSLDSGEINFRKIDNYVFNRFISKDEANILKEKYKSGSLPFIYNFDDVLNFLSSYGWEMINMEKVNDTRFYPNKEKIYITFKKP